MINNLIPGFDSGKSAMENIQEVMKKMHSFIPTIIRSLGSFVKFVGAMIAEILHGIDYIAFGQIDDDMIDSIAGGGARIAEAMNAAADDYKSGAEERVTVNQKQNDFIFSKGTVTPIDSRDQFMGVKPTGYFDTSQKEMGRKMEELTNAINRLADSSGNSGQKIEMDGRVVAEIIDRRIQDKYSFNLPSSGRIR